MSVIKDLIAQLELEDEARFKESERLSAEQDQKYEKMRTEVDYFKDETTKYINNIIKSLEELLANKSSIEKMLEQSDDLVGLPIPYEHHKNTVDLVSKVTEFINNSLKHLDLPKVISPNEIHEDLIAATESVALDLKECHTEVVQAQTLYSNTKCLKNMVQDSDDNESQKLHNSSYRTILE